MCFSWPSSGVWPRPLNTTKMTTRTTGTLPTTRSSRLTASLSRTKNFIGTTSSVTVADLWWESTAKRYVLLVVYYENEERLSFLASKQLQELQFFRSKVHLRQHIFMFFFNALLTFTRKFQNCLLFCQNLLKNEKIFHFFVKKWAYFHILGKNEKSFHFFVKKWETFPLFCQKMRNVSTFLSKNEKSVHFLSKNEKSFQFCIKISLKMRKICTFF